MQFYVSKDGDGRMQPGSHLRDKASTASVSAEANELRRRRIAAVEEALHAVHELGPADGDEGSPESRRR